MQILNFKQLSKKEFDKDLHLREYNDYLKRGFVIAYTDGSCWHKDKIGGYGVYLKYKEILKKISVGPFLDTTISKMELLAILDTLRITQKNYKLIIYSDSEYSVMAINQWMENWFLGDRPNGVIFLQILKELKKFDYKPVIRWIPGHFGIYGNEQADKLATSGRKRRK